MMSKQLLFVAFAAFLSCSAQKEEYKSPKGYDLNKPEKFPMPDVLSEISGMSFHNGNSDTLYAEQDEDGKLYYLHLGEKKTGNIKFGKKGDYEDIAILNDLVIILRSDGTLFSFPFKDIHQEEITAKEWNGILPAGEFEGMYADEKNSLLYILCKDCKGDETNEAVTTYILSLQPDGSLKQNGNATISVKTIEEKLAGEERFKFHPSAVSKSPVTDQWFILSAVNKMLVIADKDWNVQEVYRLYPRTFRQAEGIAFDNQNNLYISNEGDELSDGNVLKFVFKKE